MRALVTGCAGFIGSHLCERLLADGHEVVGVDVLTDYYAVGQKRHNLSAFQHHPRFTLRMLDLAEADLAPVVAGVELVFHQAAQPGVRASWGESFEIYARNNVVATQRLLEAVKGQPLRKFVYASSSSIYGDAEALPTSEDALPKPVSPYGVTKLGGEQLAYLYWRNHGVPTVALRYFTVYGPRQRPDMAFHRFIRAALTGDPIAVYGDGEQTRDFTYVADAVEANIAAAASDAAGEVFNIGGGSRVSINDVLAIVQGLTGRPLDVRYQPTERGDVRHTSAGIARARARLGYRPRVALGEGLAAEVAWMSRLLEASEPLPALVAD